MRDFILGIVCVVIVVAGTTGWIMNIMALVTDHGTTGMALARVAGIFIFPIGAILGWF